ncbi:hypothetical protein DFJ73DRAFT_630362 [Zopfochytrium polystomum]|nr:hypothetical protein DFJ73DRAFT_630362 [Zopfochytrium polystomum]
MVVLTVKRNNDLVLLYETTVSAKAGDVIADICKLYNAKMRLQRLIDAAADIVTHGLLKPLDQHGYSIEELEQSASENKEPAPPKEPKYVDRGGQRYMVNPDPTGRRTGECPLPEIAEVVNRTIDAAKTLVSTEYPLTNNFLSMEQIEEAMRNIGGSLTIAYPMGMPEWETAKAILEDDEDLTGTAASKEVFLPNESAIWWAGRELTPEKLLSEFLGKNEKTKVIVKLQKKSQGAPVRESPFDEKAQKELMAYYYKKQEQQKKLEENDDDDYLNSPWANPKSLKSSFIGVQNVSWRPK